MSESQYSLSNLFCADEIKILEVLIDTLIPHSKNMIGGKQAGVIFYVAKALHLHHKDTLTIYKRLLNDVQKTSLSMYAKDFINLTEIERVKLIKAVEKKNRRDFYNVRNQFFEGFFAHPHWRDSSDFSIWESIHFIPLPHPDNHP